MGQDGLDTDRNAESDEDGTFDESWLRKEGTVRVVFAVKATAACERCGCDIPTNGVCTDLICPSCGEKRALTEDFWKKHLSQVDLADTFSHAKGWESEDASPFIRRGSPFCEECGALMGSHLVDGAARGEPTVCEECGLAMPSRLADREVKHLMKEAVAVLGESAAGLSSPLTVRCSSCSGVLGLPDGQREIPCGHCGETYRLPERIWQRLKPGMLVREFFVVADVEEETKWQWLAMDIDRLNNLFANYQPLPAGFIEAIIDHPSKAVRAWAVEVPGAPRKLLEALDEEGNKRDEEISRAKDSPFEEEDEENSEFDDELLEKVQAAVKGELDFEDWEECEDAEPYLYDESLMKKRDEGALVYGFRAMVQCPGCGSMTGIPGIVDRVRCAGCLEQVHIGAEQWKAIFSEETLADGYCAAEGVGVYSNILHDSGWAVYFTFRRNPPYCHSCEGRLPDEMTGVLMEGQGVFCPLCGKRIEARPAGAGERDLIPGVLSIVGEVQELEAPKPGTPLSFKCCECAGDLSADGTERTVACGFCKARNLLPDTVWEKFHPRKPIGEFYILANQDLGQRWWWLTNCSYFWDRFEIEDVKIPAKALDRLANHPVDDIRQAVKKRLAELS